MIDANKEKAVELIGSTAFFKRSRHDSTFRALRHPRLCQTFADDGKHLVIRAVDILRLARDLHHILTHSPL
jgi:hypothetical protein